VCAIFLIKLRSRLRRQLFSQQCRPRAEAVTISVFNYAS